MEPKEARKTQDDPGKGKIYIYDGNQLVKNHHSIKMQTHLGKPILGIKEKRGLAFCLFKIGGDPPYI